MTNAIELNGLRKSFKAVKALDGVSLTVKEGELFGLLGENGAGKTTLIRILCGLCDKDGGDGKICGLDIVKDREKLRSLIGMSPQETAVAPNLTVAENIRFFADIYGVKDEEYINEIVQTFRLRSAENKRAKTLSGGWQRKLSLAVALICRPKLLFLDEPTLGLDVMARRELWEIIRSLKGKITIVLTSHYLEEIEALCDRVCILSQGKLLSCGTSEELKTQTGKATFEEAFISLINENKGEIV
jgi:ABC-2 type transport system ATP-binding protein